MKLFVVLDNQYAAMWPVNIHLFYAGIWPTKQVL